MISGGVSSIPTTNAPTKIYGRFAARDSGVVTPAMQSKMVAIGTSNARPNAKNNSNAKLKKEPISGIHSTPAGTVEAINLEYNGMTTK